MTLDLNNGDKGVWIYDIETLSNVFTYTAKNRDTKELVQFQIWKEKNEIIQLIEHLKKCKGMIGYNNLNFDYPVIHYIITNLAYDENGSKLAKKIYKKAQDVINSVHSQIKEEDVLIQQLDLFRIWHFDNKARITSLKKLEINMNYPNVQDMPYHHSEKLTTQSQVDEVLSYNINDVNATEEFYYKTEDKLNLRKGLLSKYGLRCLNYPDSKIGEELMLQLYCEATNQNPSVVKRKRTHRRSFKFIECIPDYIKYETSEFNELLNYIKSIEVTELKESFKYSFTYKGFTFDLGTGGIHGCIKPGVYKSTENEVIVDADVASLYPSLAITLGLYPEHLGSEFAEIYEKGIVAPRLEAKKSGDKVMADGFKLSANSVYGKSNSEYSFLCDPLYTLKTTLAGQLALCMLSESLMTRIPESVMLQINTDGLTMIIPKNKRRLYWEICQEWEAKTRLILEYVAYSQMIIRDVNNYIAVAEKTGKVKYKGTFKDNYEMRKDGEWQKSFSQGIVATSVNKFFLEGKPVEETISECRDIYEFCKTGNTTGEWKAETFELNGSGEVINQIPQQKNNRYFISNNGVSFRKYTYKPDKKTGEMKFTSTEYEAGWKVTMFNKYYEVDDFSKYDINYDYYIKECYKIIHVIDGTTERLEEESRLERERKKLEREEENYLKFCVNKVPTQLQYENYKRDWLIEKYGEPKEIKPSKVKNV